MRHGGHVHRDVFCSLFIWFTASLSLLEIVLRWVPLRMRHLCTSILLSYAFLNVSPIGIQYGSIGSNNESLGSSLWAVPVASCCHVQVWHHCRQVVSSCSATQSRPLPFSPSWMYLLGGEDTCMLSVPSGTCDFHIRCWQGGDVCQAKGTAAFTLFSYELRSSSNYG